MTKECLSPKRTAIPLLQRKNKHCFNVIVGFMITALIATSTLAALAQPESSGNNTSFPDHHRMRHIIATLGLSNEQMQKITEFHAQYRDSQKSATPETGPQLRAQYESVMTPDQRAKFDADMRHH